MKYLVVVVASLVLAQAKVLPDHLTSLLCRKSDPEYAKCVWTNAESAREFFLKGIPEVGLPPLDPFELPLMTVDRSLNDLVSIKAVLRNVKLTGARNTIVEDLKADPFNYTGGLRVRMPFLHLEMDYEVDGQLLAIPLRSKGHFKGNFTNTLMVTKGNMKLVEKDGVKYFRVDKIAMKAQVGDGEIELKSDNPDLQFGADLIANFFNENPRRVFDAVNPIFVETGAELFRVVADQILAHVPAKEWLPDK